MSTTYQHRTKKHFGQHFLHDANIIERIVDAIALKADQATIEIGPGAAALTSAMIERRASISAKGRLVAIEIDRDAVAYLTDRFNDQQLYIIAQDVLKVDFTNAAAQCQAPLSTPFCVVGNLPYNISSPILFHLMDYADQLSHCVFMLQKEVVDRMVAPPGSDDYGRLSVMLQYRFAMSKLFKVAPGAFTPPPKVDSAIVRMTPLPDSRPRAKDFIRFSQIVAAGFQQRRKTLLNSTKGILSLDQITAAGIDPKVRAETLGVAEFIRLADASLADA
jgi:16S rRNA (adenine1518-N6/adenine1519-N6)-dimethyltransferase